MYLNTVHQKWLHLLEQATSPPPSPCNNIAETSHSISSLGHSHSISSLSHSHSISSLGHSLFPFTVLGSQGVEAYRMERNSCEMFLCLVIFLTTTFTAAWRGIHGQLLVSIRSPPSAQRIQKHEGWTGEEHKITRVQTGD